MVLLSGELDYFGMIVYVAISCTSYLAAFDRRQLDTLRIQLPLNRLPGVVSR